jgi:hypothetical protein
MSEQWSEVGSERRDAGSEANGSWSANGVGLEDPADTSDGSVAAADEPVAESSTEVAIEGEASAPAADDIADVSAEPAEADDGPAAIAADQGSMFLAELARSMQAAAGAEHVRVGEETERLRQEHIDGIRARQSSEADRMRELAGEDLKSIDEWAEGEKKRIEIERERRATELNEDLQISLTEHSAKIDIEIEGVEAAIATYRAEVDDYFAGLDRETDVVQIARLATRRPAFPALDALIEIESSVTGTVAPEAEATTESEPWAATTPPAATDDGATAPETAGESEPAVVGVMDPDPAAEPGGSWTAPGESVPTAALDAVDQGDEGFEAAEPVATAAGASPNGSSSLFQSVPVLRPMSWLRRDSNSGDRPNGES